MDTSPFGTEKKSTQVELMSFETFKENKMKFFKILLQWLGLEKKKNPKAEMQKIINYETKKLIESRTSLDKSGGYVRKLFGQVSSLKNDIVRLETKVQNAVDQGKDEIAKNWLIRLNEKKSLLAEAECTYEQAREQHNNIVDAIEVHQASMRRIQQEAQSLQVQLDLAEARAAAASFQSDLKNRTDYDLESAKEEITREIRSKNAKASLDESLLKNPDEDFLAEDEKEKLNEQLSQFKNRNKGV